MQATATKGDLTTVAADVLVVPVLDGETTARSPLKELDRALGGELSRAIERKEVTGKALEAAMWPAMGLAAGRLLLVGAGKRDKFDADMARKIAGVAARRTATTFGTVALVLRSDAHAEASVEGFVMGAYEPDLYRKERKATKTTTFTLVTSGDVRRAVTSGQAIAEATNLCRTLVSEPPNEMTPTALAERAKAELEPVGVKVEILKGKQLARFGGLLGVSKGSDEPPVFISMAWEPARAKKTPVLGLVGKGVTFDSGGLSLKTADGMTTMKSDMAGAAAVICAMRAIAELKVPLQVRAAVPSTENMPSGKATRVGDVLHPYSGKTIEVLNTDAEGRLILADGLAWLAEQGVTHMADAATLTGAIVTSLGKVAFGVMGRPDRWVDRVLGASRRAGEKAWQLPLYDEYREMIRSDIADVKNIGGPGAGSITAAWFLAEFVPDDIPWAHLDIAGVAMDDAKPYLAKGATGAGVRAFTRLAQEMAAKP